MTSEVALERKRRIFQTALTIVFLAGGGAICAWLVETRPLPPRRASFARVPEVVVSPVVATFHQNPVVGYGTVRPRTQVNVVPQVSGKLVYAHPDLAQGKVIAKGELLFEIDPTVHEARVAQVEAEVRRLEAVLERQDQELANLETRISSAREMLAIEEKDYLATKRLYEVEHVGTQRDVDLVYQKYLRQKDVLAELTSRRSMIPHLKLETQAQLDATRARLKHATYDLEGTKILSPFTARVEAVHARASQVVTAFLSIATLTDMGAFEIPVGIDPRELRWLDEAIRPAALEENGGGSGPEVTVRWSLHGQQFTWKGYVTRFERVDERTRTAQMVVEVRDVDMMATVDAGTGEVGPALSIGMFCSAELPAQPLDEAVLIPRHAIYENKWVYAFEAAPHSPDPRTGRLVRRQVPMLRAVGDFVLVDYRGREGTEVCELHPGDQLVVSPLVKPVVGMTVRLRDEQLAADEPVLPTYPTNEDPREILTARNAVLAHVGPLPGGG
jgi:multidrug efflux pump subunit AcrA (membrane-fusion protein)